MKKSNFRYLEIIQEDISNIFKSKAEKFFRDLEEKLTLDILKKKQIIVIIE